MSVMYDEYIKKHVYNVIRAYDWLREHIPDIRESLDISDRSRIEKHDKSKWSDEEYAAYDEYFYGIRGRNRSFKVVRDFKEAWLHHIHCNPHHWQHWVLIEDDSKGGPICLEMPHEYVIEMIADWWSFSWASGNLYEIFDWYKAHENIMLHPDTKELVDYILGKIKDELDKEQLPFNRFVEKENENA